MATATAVRFSPVDDSFAADDSLAVDSPGSAATDSPDSLVGEPPASVVAVGVGTAFADASAGEPGDDEASAVGAVRSSSAAGVAVVAGAVVGCGVSGEAEAGVAFALLAGFCEGM
ncbi:hypothetical protein [Streptomyces sp. NPDC047829]|uniref:hypothetical protein n=1 Tax=Streptomyces sp. NPDC047829 TaxID=3154609 RepID=UPI0033D9ADC9